MLRPSATHNRRAAVRTTASRGTGGPESASEAAARATSAVRCCALLLAWLPFGTALGGEPVVGLADAAALRATVYGAPPQDIAPLPARVPLAEIDITVPWARQPRPAVFWFARRLRVWFAEQPGPAPLAIVISGTGNDGNTSSQSLLRAILYGAGYHVLSLPSPTFPGFIAAASTTGVAGDLRVDSHDLYLAIGAILARLPHRIRITDIDVLGYSLGGANAAMIKALDAHERRLAQPIHRALMINPPVNLFASINRLDQLFVSSIGSGDAGIERLYRTLYVRLANFYRSDQQLRLEDTDLMTAAAALLRTDNDFAAAVAFSFRLALMNVFFAGDLYAGTGVVTDARHPPRLGEPTDPIEQKLRNLPFAAYFERVFLPYYLAHSPGSTRESLIAESDLNSIAAELRGDGDYYAQTNADDAILDRAELDWLRDTLHERIAVYEHGGHLGNLGERRQAADMLAMLGGDWRGAAP